MSIASFAFIILCLQVMVVEMHYISGKIDNNVGFYSRKLSVFPSKMARIQFSVEYSRSRPYAVLNFYTTEEHINVQK